MKVTIEKYCSHFKEISEEAQTLMGYVRLLPFLDNDAKYERFKSIKDSIDDKHKLFNMFFEEFCEIYMLNMNFWDISNIESEEDILYQLTASNASEIIYKELTKRIGASKRTRTNLAVFLEILAALENVAFKD